MLTFEPASLSDEIAAAFRIIADKTGLSASELSEDAYNPGEPGFDPSDHEDAVITPASTLGICLPECEDVFEITYGELVSLANDLESAKLRDNLDCRMSTRYLLRLEPAWYEDRKQLESAFLAEQPRSRRVCSCTCQIDSIAVSLGLIRGVTAFGLLIVAEGAYDDYFPPILGEEVFLEISFEAPLSEDQIESIVAGYLFELSSTLELTLKRCPRPFLIQVFEEEETVPSSAPIRLRPLLLGKGLPEVLSLFNRASIARDPEHRLLHFAKVIEHVAQTVVRQQSTDLVRAKLLSARALDPDADYILELVTLVDDLRIYRKDREALKLALMTCCEPRELARIAPPFLAKLKSLHPRSSAKECEDALVEFAGAVYSTRGAVAHAKPNYTPTGEECPENQLTDFVSCVDLAAQQAIRWYYARHDSQRVTGRG